MEFSQIAKELREETGLSQQKLSEKLGISSSGIGHLEVGDNEPTSSTLIAYAKYFDVSADYLLGLIGSAGARTVAPIGDAYSSEERKIIEQYRSLPKQLKKLVRDQLEVYCAPNELLPNTHKKV